MIAEAEFIAGLPKAELHVHLEGTFSVEMKQGLAARNNLTVNEKVFTPLEVKYKGDSQALEIQQYKYFLGLYYEGLKVLQKEEDFYDLCTQYYEHCSNNKIVYAEIMFDPQPHTNRGIPFEAVIGGLDAARKNARQALGIESGFIMCINRDLPVESSLELLKMAAPFRDSILGLGLDSVEEDNPPVKFAEAYDIARGEGYRVTAHCDVDMVNATEHIRQCIEVLKVSRIDHGINVLDDPKLIELALDHGISFTACPTWRNGDAGPRRVDRIEKMRQLGLEVSLHSDDPGYFTSGYMNHMLGEVANVGKLTKNDLAKYMTNAFESAWLPTESKNAYLDRLNTYVQASS